jgi:hypothetical protein
VPVLAHVCAPVDAPSSLVSSAVADVQAATLAYPFEDKRSQLVLDQDFVSDVDRLFAEVAWLASAWGMGWSLGAG